MVPKIPKNTILNIFIYLLYCFFSTNFGHYKSYPLNRNLALEICKKRDIEGLVILALSL
jgi:hypothetical protein